MKENGYESMIYPYLTWIRYCDGKVWVTALGEGDYEAKCSGCEQEILFRKTDLVHRRYDEHNKVIGLLCTQCHKKQRI